MAIIETKADDLMNLIDEKKKISTKDAAKLMNLPEVYVRKLAIALDRNNLIGLDASAFSLEMVSLAPVSSVQSGSAPESF